MHWIEPLKEQLDRLERRFESSLGATTCRTSTSTCNEPSVDECHEDECHDEQGDDDASECEGTNDTG